MHLHLYILNDRGGLGKVGVGFGGWFAWNPICILKGGYVARKSWVGFGGWFPWNPFCILNGGFVAGKSRVGFWGVARGRGWQSGLAAAIGSRGVR